MDNLMVGDRTIQMSSFLRNILADAHYYTFLGRISVVIFPRLQGFPFLGQTPQRMVRVLGIHSVSSIFG